MDHLHGELDIGPNDIVEVSLDHAANVQLLDAINYDNYRHGRPYRYHGGYAKSTPVRLKAPSRGRWHLVVDLGGNAGTVRAGVRVIPSPVEATSR